MIKTVFFIILGVVFTILVFNIGQKYNEVSKSSKIKVQPTKVEQQNSRINIPVSDKSSLTFEEAIQSKSKAELENFMGENVQFSHFESEYSKTFTSKEAASELTSYLEKASVWVVDQDNSDIQKLKDFYPQAYFDSYIILSNENGAIAFSRNKDKKILDIVYMSNYPRLLK